MCFVLVLSLFLIDVVYSSSKTVVFTFDAVNSATQYKGGEELARLKIGATFYYSSQSRVGSKMSLSEIKTLYNIGHEIGGQSLYYEDLTKLDDADIQKQICLNRKYLLQNNLYPKSFAYPFGKSAFKVSVLAIKCGYASATSGEVSGNAVQDLNKIQKENAFDIKTVSLKENKNVVSLRNIINNLLPVDDTDTTDKLLVFKIYEMCESCATNGLEYGVLTEFVQWILSSRRDIKIKMMKDIIPGDVQPLPTGYEDGIRLLPETESKLIVAMSTVGGMIVFILAFFVSESIRNKCKK